MEKKIVMTPYKVYLEYDGQRVELESGELTEERPARGKLPETHRFLDIGIFSCEVPISLKTFMGLYGSNICVKFRDVLAFIPTKDLIWNSDGEAAYYVWKDESYTFTWTNYMKDWAFTLEGFGEQK